MSSVTVRLLRLWQVRTENLIAHWNSSSGSSSKAARDIKVKVDDQLKTYQSPASFAEGIYPNQLPTSITGRLSNVCLYVPFMVEQPLLSLKTLTLPYQNSWIHEKWIKMIDELNTSAKHLLFHWRKKPCSNDRNKVHGQPKDEAFSENVRIASIVEKLEQISVFNAVILRLWIIYLCNVSGSILVSVTMKLIMYSK